MKVTIDQGKCVSSGQCVMAVSQVFDQRDEDGVVVLLDADPPPELISDVRHAAMVCPARAITLGE